MNDETKLDRLKVYLQESVNTAWHLTKNSQLSHDESFGDALGKDIKFLLDNDSELPNILNDIAFEEYQELEQEIPIDPPNFREFIRSTGTANYVEVFVGNKWEMVPSDAYIDFATTSNNGFRVTISHNGNYREIVHTPAAEDVEAYIKENSTIQVTEVKDFDWKSFGGQVYNRTTDNVGMLDDAASVYMSIPKEFKRHYAYKISKVAKTVGQPAKAGKIFQGAKRLGKIGKKLGPIGDVLTVGNIGYEVLSDIWDAHTVVDGTLLVVGIAATAAGAPAVLIGIAIYGILDYAFDISEGLDKYIGRDSGFWDNKPLRDFPSSREPLFREIQIDKTYVAPKYNPLKELKR
ncbi:hypothetical protein JM658_10865 [Joostella atrarenae]|uniref:Uncharacterized protein n=1 Tax=Joostella atrarenae TaxID=679257 RepID=A0ABS9J4H2_9FLAO|nr:hypothetical protein [Joostella atrarenae]MCF8715329.1 hypothetical protein [Joostella atrarenae]